MSDGCIPTHIAVLKFRCLNIRCEIISTHINCIVGSYNENYPIYLHHQDANWVKISQNFETRVMVSLPRVTQLERQRLIAGKVPQVKVCIHVNVYRLCVTIECIRLQILFRILPSHVYLPLAQVMSTGTICFGKMSPNFITLHCLRNRICASV